MSLLCAMRSDFKECGVCGLLSDVRRATTTVG